MRLAPLFLALCGAVPAAAQQVIPLAPYGQGALRSVPVVIAGDTLDFLFDTGGGVTVISPALAARVGCTPGGRAFGLRMTGQPVTSPVCDAVPLRMADYEVQAEASVFDLMTILGPNAPPVHGMISLRAFAGRAVTLDLRGQQLIVETPRSLEQRVRGMQPVPVRLATGPAGGELDAFVGIPAGDAHLWMLWDSGHQGPTFVAPWSAQALGITPEQTESELPLGAAAVLTPLTIKSDLIHDGVLHARLLERTAWTLDLASARMWSGDVSGLLTVPAETAGASIAPPASDPQGWYEVTLQVNGQPQRAILHLGPDRVTELRFIGEERVFALRDVRAAGNTLSFALPMGRTYSVQLEFDGLHGAGTWGDAARGGMVSATKIR